MRAIFSNAGHSICNALQVHANKFKKIKKFETVIKLENPQRYTGDFI